MFLRLGQNLEVLESKKSRIRFPREYAWEYHSGILRAEQLFFLWACLIDEMEKTRVLSLKT